MTRIAEVFINLPVKSITNSFSYLVPEELAFINIGWRVVVPFGGRKAEGFVVNFSDGESTDLKTIIDAIDTEPWFTEHMLAVAKWLSTYYLCTPAEAMRLFIPGKSGMKFVKQYHALHTEAIQAKLVDCQGSQRELYDFLLKNGPLTLRQLSVRFNSANLNSYLRQLVSIGLIETDSLATKAARHNYITFWQLALKKEAIEAAVASMPRKPMQKKLLEELLIREKLTSDDLKQLKISSSTIKVLENNGLITSSRIQLIRDSYAGISAEYKKLEFSFDQKKALAEIEPALDAKTYQSYLLFGITGSGKTQVYIEAAAKARKLGRQVIVLVPEIALTGQIVTRFKARFGQDVVVLHSKLSVGERFDTWQRIRCGDASIVIGARSAVFAPVSDPGLFIIDEEHEFTYKQEEAPHYHTRLVAQKRAELAGALVIMGSATPSVETFYESLNGLHNLLEMPNRIDGVPLPEVTVVDMREELKEGRKNVVSLAMKEMLTSTLFRTEQAIILLNRRGYSTFVICRECGHVMKCDHCAVSLVYHSTGGGRLRCHYCETQQALPDICPSCNSRYIRYFGTGTQKVEEELSTLFPAAKIIRMDQDTTGAKMAHDTILKAFATGKYDILLGTQMVAKGHDIKNVTAVGIISADTALNLPDFRAAERTFAMLTQAAGRAGRGNLPGKVVIQTYNPEHYAVTSGSKHDFTAFYNQEIEFRRQLGYPPFTRLIKLTFLGSDEIKVRKSAEQAANELELALNGSGEVIGPFSAPIVKINDVHRIHILIKTKDIIAANNHVRSVGLAFRRDVAVDVDPLNVL